MTGKRLRKFLTALAAVGMFLPLSTVVQIGSAVEANDITVSQESQSSELTNARKQLLGLWRGRYICSQGETGLDLTITEIEEGYLSDDFEIKAIFAFYNLPGRKNSGEGSFSMLGHFDPRSFNINLEPDSWIDRPPGWMMVSIKALVSMQKAEIRGSIETGGCGAMRVERKKVSP